MIPVLPLRDVVVYPHMVIPLFVGRDRSIQALQRAMEDDKRILLVAQKDAGQDNPTIDEIYRVGTVSTILQLLKLPDGTVKVLVRRWAASANRRIRGRRVLPRCEHHRLGVGVRGRA